MKFYLTDLKTNNMPAPLGIDDLPHFSFRIVCDDPEFEMKAYRIKVTEGKKTVWNSGKVAKAEQILIPYGGEALKPQTRYDWKVTVYDAEGEQSGETSYFETGKMQEFNWKAKWITSDPRGIFIGNHWCKNTTAPYLRKTFEITKDIEDAALYISGIGYYEVYANGVSLKDSVLDPAFTEYDKTVMYLTHKVPSLRKGKNALAILLGDGYYNADTEDVWNFVNADWRDHPKCICELLIKYKDGSEERIVSDSTFKGAVGPFLKNDVRSAEEYDAGKELGDWTSADYDDSGWRKVTVTKAPGGALEGQYTTPIKVVDEYKPAEIIKVSDKYWVADVGFNTVGWAKIAFEAPRGTRIEMKYVELINDDNTIKRSLEGCTKPQERDLFQKDIYIAKGEGRECWHARFKYSGFRYVAITCETGIPADFDIVIQEVRTDLKQAGGFTCSSEMINKIQEITCRATKCNFHGMPTDCPHREKNGWTGDAQLSAEQMLLNYDAQAAYSRWLDDVRRAQRRTGQLPGIIPSTGWGFNWGSGPAWDSVCTVIPYNMYLYKGDKRIIGKMYPVIKKYIEFCDSMATDNICCFGLGDWCPPGDSWHKQCELAVTDTAYYYYDVQIAAKAAGILGNKEEKAFYEAKSADIRKSFRDRFIDVSGSEPALKNCTPCQTSYACILYYGFADEDEKPVFMRKMIDEIKERDYHFDVGILGQKYICNVLADNGYTDLLVKVISSPEYPGLGNMVALGATTLWEDFKGSSSQNHHMFGDVSGCFYKAIAGIRPCEEEPGFKKILFTPSFPEDLSFADGWHDSPYGKICSSWKKSDGKVSIELTVPSGSHGELILPEGYVLCGSGKSSVEVKCGKYSFTARKA